ncbi:MAG: motility associated factor glycosyltransferase family protein [Butyrivibrio sp.]|nr:motility associated factor glycosyltransferase family protein [Butyrivibrio sp.]
MMADNQMMILEIDEALRQRNFRAYQKRYGICPSIDPEEKKKYLVTQAGDGGLVLCIRMTDGETERWVPLNSMEAPASEARQWAEEIEIPNKRTIVFLLGFSIGYQLAALMQALRPDTDYYVYEPQEGLFAFICGFIDISELFLPDSRVTLALPGWPEGQLFQLLQNAVLWGRTQLLVLKSPGYADHASFTAMGRRLLSMMEENRNYNRYIGRRAFQNRLHAWGRLADNAFVYDLLDRIPASMPIVIVAAGPSLVHNAGLLRELKGRAMIVCVDRAVHTLEQFDITPDLLVTVDAIKDTSYLVSPMTDTIPLLCSFQSMKRTQEHFDGRCIYCHPLEEEKLIPGIRRRITKRVDSSGNVAGVALSVFLAHGSKTVILVGQDLAMAGKESHSDGSHVGLSKGSKIVFVEGIDGKPVASREDWVGFLRSYEQVIRLFPKTRVIDATEGGAKIHGSEVMTLREAIDSFCAVTWDLEAVFRDLPRAQTHVEHEETIRLMQQWQTELKQITQACSEVIPLYEKIIRICRFHDIREKRNESLLKKADQVRSRINELPVNSILEQSWIERTEMIPDRMLVARNNEEALPVFEEALAYYRHLPEDCRSLSEAIQAVIDECED